MRVQCVVLKTWFTNRLPEGDEYEKEFKKVVMRMMDALIAFHTKPTGGAADIRQQQQVD
jgi:hypothetical protein